VNRAATGSDANITARYVGSAIGLALVTVSVAHGLGHDPADIMRGWNAAVLITVGMSVLGGLIVLLARDRATGDRVALADTAPAGP
jgi:hypothetical protein